MTLVEKLRRAEFVVAGYAHMSRRSIQTEDGQFLDDLLHEAADAIAWQPKVGVGQQGIE